MKKIIICLLMIFPFFSFSQELDFENIKLSINHDRRIPFNKTSFEIRKLKNDSVIFKVKSNPSNKSKEWNYSKIDTAFYLTKRNLLIVIESIKKIEYNHIYGNIKNEAVDGYECKLEYGNPKNYIAYSINTPTFYTKERNLTNFLNTCKLIISYSGLDIFQILEKPVTKKEHESIKNAIINKRRKQ